MLDLHMWRLKIHRNTQDIGNMYFLINQYWTGRNKEIFLAFKHSERKTRLYKNRLCINFQYLMLGKAARKDIKLLLKVIGTVLLYHCACLCAWDVFIHSSIHILMHGEELIV